MDSYPIFISYSRKDIGQLAPIKTLIEEKVGCKCWMDLRAIESGSKRFTKDIINGINNCKVFLFLLSENSQQSEFALRELAFADKKGKHVVIVNVENCTMTDEFEFLYGLTDTISWPDKLQREKLLLDLKQWVGLSTPSEPIKPDEKEKLELERLLKELRLKEEEAEKARQEDLTETWEKIEKGRLALEQMLKEKEERKLEMERLALEQKQKVEAERKLKDEAEKARIQQEQEEQKRKEAEEKERLEMERFALEQKQKEEAERKTKEEAEKARIIQEQKELRRKEAEEAKRLEHPKPSNRKKKFKKFLPLIIIGGVIYIIFIILLIGYLYEVLSPYLQ